jgi:hypothetical protein
MKSKLLLLPIFAFCSFLNAQTPANGNFTFLESIACPFNENEEVVWPENWMIYQTTNGEWDGEIDSTRCISVFDNGNCAGIELEQIDPNLPIYIRSTSLSDNDYPLFANSIYQVFSLFRILNGVFQDGIDCSDGLCTGMIIGQDIPAEDGVNRDMRIYSQSIEDIQQCDMTFCMPTEQFENAFLREFIFKFSFPANTDLSGQVLELCSAYNEWSDYPTEVEEFFIPESSFDGSSYNGNISNFAFTSWGGQHFLVVHDETYPSASNITLVEATLQENQPSPQVINMTVDEHQNLYFQPFTEVRGGLVEGSDSLRHTFNIINNSGEWCFGSIVDIIFSGETHIISNGGRFEFAGRSSCFAFHKGASLVIGENTTLHYASSGNGALGLLDGGTIEFEPNSHLVMDGRMVLWDLYRNPNHSVDIHLPKGCSLTFDKHGALDRIGYTETGFMKLNVYMEGGILNDDNLSDKEKALINRIYPPANNNFSDNIKVFPNPFEQQTEIEYLSDQEENIQVELINLSGQRVHLLEYNAFKGLNYFPLDMSNQAIGTYIIRIQSDKGSYVQKVVKS